ncbi:TPA: class I SAM-dependent methyltransferase [Pseudomonas aeruginosa]|nr:class I SAM-dependent methyltransferase [Pseudomonas aeruginosa]
MARLSPRLQQMLDALPLRPGLRVLEVGCGPGALARAIAARVAPGQVLGIDRSAHAIEQAMASSGEAIAAGHLSFRQVAAEDFVLGPGEAPFDLIVAVRVGAFDGRHPDAGARAWPRMAAALAPGGTPRHRWGRANDGRTSRHASCGGLSTFPDFAPARASDS